MSLDCGQNNLRKLNVRGAIALRFLNCSDNELLELDLSGSRELLDLDCRRNLIERLDVSANISLVFFLYDPHVRVSYPIRAF